MKEKEISVRHIYFTLLKEGTKKVEGRLYDSFFRDLDIGDKLIFIDETTSEKLKTTVLKIDVFKGFDEMINHFGREVLGFASHSYEDTLKTYNSFYTTEEINELGVCGVTVEKE